MTTSAFQAYGSVLQAGDGAGTENFSTIAEVIDITPPALSKDDIEATSQDSADGYREYIPGLKDGGTLTFNCNWLPSNATQDEVTGLLESFNDDDVHNWKLILPDTVKTCDFAGYLNTFDPDLPLDSKGELSVTIKISGKPTYS